MKKVSALVLLCACLLAVPAQAATGKLDPSFGSGGRVIWPTSTSGFPVAPQGQVAESPDGRTFVLVDQRSLLGFGPEGQIDAGFGAGGSLQIFRPDDLVVGGIGVAVDPWGRIVVATTVSPPEGPRPSRGWQDVPIGQIDQAILLARFNPDGQPDPSFGEGGRIVTRLGIPPPPAAPGYELEPGIPRPANVASGGLAIDPAGRILLSGQFLAAYEACGDAEHYGSRREAFVARLDGAGQPDQSFGRGGVAVLREGPVGRPVADPSGGVFAAVGTPYPACPGARQESTGYLFHLDDAGAPVASFGRGGWRTVPEDPYVKMLADRRGGLIMMPSGPPWGDSPTLRRLDPNGAWDRGFGRRGTAEPFPNPKGALYFTDAVLDPRGRIYVSATWGRKLREQGPKRRFVLFRLGPRGRLDRDYGVLRTGFGDGSSALARALLIAPGGRPLAVGSISSPLLAPSGAGVALARYLATG